METQLDRTAERETALYEEMSVSGTDHGRLDELQTELEALLAERERLETTWLEASALLEG